MKFNTNQNLCPLILSKYKQEDAAVSFNGFYSLDIIFNDPPYFIIEHNGKFLLGSGKEPNAILGHYFKINGKTFIVGDNGIYHLESTEKFIIKSLYLLKEEDVNVTYHISLAVYNNDTTMTDISLPKPYYSEYKNAPEQRWGVYPSNYGLITVPDNCTGIDIEADKNCVFAIDGQQIIIGETERFVYPNKLTTLEYKGHFNINLTEEENKIVTRDKNGKLFMDDLSITFFREGGDDQVTLDTTGVIGYFNTDSDSLSMTKNKWYNKMRNTEISEEDQIAGSDYLALNSVTENNVTTSPSYEGGALKAIGGQIGDFICEDTPKVIYIVIKKDEAGVDNCIVATSKVNASADGGFSIWQTNSFEKPDTIVDTPYVLGLQDKTELFHCLAIARQNTVNTDGKNGVMFFVDGVLMGFVDDNSYDSYGSKVSFLRFLTGEDGYSGVCNTDAYIKAILIGTQEHSIKQILNNTTYLQKTYI